MQHPSVDQSPGVTHEDLSSMTEPKGQTRIRNKVGEAVVTAKDSRFGVVREASNGALLGGLEGQSGGGAFLILQL